MIDTRKPFQCLLAPRDERAIKTIQRHLRAVDLEASKTAAVRYALRQTESAQNYCATVSIAGQSANLYSVRGQAGRYSVRRTEKHRQHAMRLLSDDFSALRAIMVNYNLKQAEAVRFALREQASSIRHHSVRHHGEESKASGTTSRSGGTRRHRGESSSKRRVAG